MNEKTRILPQSKLLVALWEYFLALRHKKAPTKSFLIFFEKSVDKSLPM